MFGGQHSMAGQRTRAEIAAMNRLYYGDNLDILRNRVDSESVDLCYIDPPFNSKRNYFQIYNNQGGEDRAASVSPKRWTEIPKVGSIAHCTHKG